MLLSCPNIIEESPYELHYEKLLLCILKLEVLIYILLLVSCVVILMALKLVNFTTEDSSIDIIQPYTPNPHLLF